ncbi:MAG: DNA polymerase III subunit delta [Lachnospiraceae bacterium]|nr:DNA polymerase III subunit delta [Lachnospiraceae bacterium]
MNRKVLSVILKTVDTLLQDVKEKQFKRVYLITGDDPWLRHGFLSRLSAAVSGDDTMNRMEVTGSDISLPALRAFTDTVPFFAERRVLVIEESGLFRVRKKGGSEDGNSSGEEFQTPPRDASEEENDETAGSSSDDFQNWIKTLPETAVVIFTETKADGRSALYKLVSKLGSVTVVNRPKNAEELRRFALSQIGKSGLRITSAAFDKVMERLPLDYGTAETELEKLISRCLEKGSILPEDVEEMMTPRLEDRVFELVGKVSSGDRDGALRCYYDLVALKTPPLLILTLVGKEFVRLLNVQDMAARGLSEREITEAMSFSKDWLTDKYRRMAGRFRRGELLAAVKYETELEQAAKSGNLNDASAAEILIVSMTRSRSGRGR